MADKDLDLSFQPQFLELQKNVQVGGGRLSGKKKLDEDSELEAYADLMGIRGDNIKGGVKVPGIGAKYRKKLDKDSSLEFYGEKRDKNMGEPWQAGVTYSRDFKNGGKVKSASERADGCCIRGKTKA